MKRPQIYFLFLVALLSVFACSPNKNEDLKFTGFYEGEIIYNGIKFPSHFTIVDRNGKA